MEIFTFDQRSPDWFQARAGVPTASAFATILASGRDGGESRTRRAYLLKLAGEILTGEPMDSYENQHMVRGRAMEEEARDLYAFLSPDPLLRVGFIKNGAKGCSPDSLVGDSGMVEIKTKLPHLAIDVLLKDEFPAEYRAQCQGALWVAEREWIDLLVYWPGLPLFAKRAYRDERYIAKLALAVDAFNAELYETVVRVRGYDAAARTTS